MHPERALAPALREDERRAEPRRPASGCVVINIIDPPGKEFAGELLDVSGRGFRATHGFRDLHSGQMVRFHHASAAGHARVVWNRIDQQRVESGFFIV